MKRDIWRIVVPFGLMAALVSTQALACRCSQRSLEAYFQRAQWVGRVEVKAMHDAQQVEGDLARPVAIRVLATHKGPVALDRVHTPASSAACGMILLPGHEYWVFAHNRHAGTDVWWVDSCTGTRPVGAEFMDADGGDVGRALGEIGESTAAVAEQQALISTRIALASIERHEVTHAMISRFAAHPVISPNGAWRAIIIEPPAEARPPRLLQVIVEREQSSLLQVSLTDVRSIVNIEWINEKLLLIEVQRDSLGMSEVVVDVGRGRIVHSQG